MMSATVRGEAPLDDVRDEPAGDVTVFVLAPAGLDENASSACRDHLKTVELLQSTISEKLALARVGATFLAAFREQTPELNDF